MTFSALNHIIETVNEIETPIIPSAIPLNISVDRLRRMQSDIREARKNLNFIYAQLRVEILSRE